MKKLLILFFQLGLISSIYGQTKIILLDTIINHDYKSSTDFYDLPINKNDNFVIETAFIGGSISILIAGKINGPSFKGYYFTCSYRNKEIKATIRNKNDIRNFKAVKVENVRNTLIISVKKQVATFFLNEEIIGKFDIKIVGGDFMIYTKDSWVKNFKIYKYLNISSDEITVNQDVLTSNTKIKKYFEKEQYLEAEKYCLKKDNLLYYIDIANEYYNLAKRCSEQENYVIAIAYYNKSITFFNKSGKKEVNFIIDSIASCYITISKNKNFSEKVQFITKAIEQFKLSGNAEKVKKCNELLGDITLEIANSRKDFDKALEYCTLAENKQKIDNAWIALKDWYYKNEDYYNHFLIYQRIGKIDKIMLKKYAKLAWESQLSKETDYEVSWALYAVKEFGNFSDKEDVYSKTCTYYNKKLKEATRATDYKNKDKYEKLLNDAQIELRVITFNTNGNDERNEITRNIRNGTKNPDEIIKDINVFIKNHPESSFNSSLLFEKNNLNTLLEFDRQFVNIETKSVQEQIIYCDKWLNELGKYNLPNFNLVKAKQEILYQEASDLVKKVISKNKTIDTQIKALYNELIKGKESTYIARAADKAIKEISYKAYEITANVSYKTTSNYVPVKKHIEYETRKTFWGVTEIIEHTWYEGGYSYEDVVGYKASATITNKTNKIITVFIVTDGRFKESGNIFIDGFTAIGGLILGKGRFESKNETMTLQPWQQKTINMSGKCDGLAVITIESKLNKIDYIIVNHSY